MSKIAEIMEKLETLTLLEAAELVEKIEETFSHEFPIQIGFLHVSVRVQKRVYS